MEGANDDQGFETSSFEKMTIKGGICYSYRKLYRGVLEQIISLQCTGTCFIYLNLLITVNFSFCNV